MGLGERLPAQAPERVAATAAEAGRLEARFEY